MFRFSHRNELRKDVYFQRVTFKKLINQHDGGFQKRVHIYVMDIFVSSDLMRQNKLPWFESVFSSVAESDNLTVSETTKLLLQLEKCKPTLIFLILSIRIVSSKYYKFILFLILYLYFSIQVNKRSYLILIKENTIHGNNLSIRDTIECSFGIRWLAVRILKLNSQVRLVRRIRARYELVDGFVLPAKDHKFISVKRS